MKRSGKYNARRTLVDGIWFASAREAARYRELRLLEKAGEAWGLELQPKFPLWAHVGDGPGGKVGEYRADFLYMTRQDGMVVEDSKGFRTPLYRWKKRHAELQHGITIREV